MAPDQRFMFNVAKSHAPVGCYDVTAHMAWFRPVGVWNRFGFANPVGVLALGTELFVFVWLYLLSYLLGTSTGRHQWLRC